MVNKISSETRKIKFRDDSYAVDSGSRFADIVPEIDMDVDEFIRALQGAILSEQKKSGVSIEKVEEEQKKKNAEEQRRIAEAERKKREEKEYEEELEGAISQIVSFFTENKANVDAVKPVLGLCKELGYANPKEITSLEDAKKVLAATLKA